MWDKTNSTASVWIAMLCSELARVLFYICEGASTLVRASDQRGDMELVDAEGEAKYCPKPALITSLLSKLCVGLYRKEKTHIISCALKRNTALLVRSGDSDCEKRQH
jgi:hypothetical protein